MRKLHPITIENYNTHYPQMFEEEKKRILPAVDKFMLKIEHVGSTSIPELGGKPIVDIMIGVASLHDADKCIEPLENLGYEYQSQDPVSNRRFFKRFLALNTGYQIHITPVDSEFWNEHLQFRNYLRKHPDLVKDYFKLKKDLARKFREDRLAYLAGKTEFIQKIMKKARKEIQID